MLQLEIELTPEYWDDEREEFIEPKTTTIRLEHSLVSVSKWESKWNKSFLSKGDKTDEEVIDYIKCMTLTPNVDPAVYTKLSRKNFEEINNYIGAPMTATYFSDNRGRGRNSEVVTSELIYYWMISLGIPIEECQKWHLNRLITLIRVCNVKSQPPKKMSRREIMSRNASLNAARRAQFNSRG